MCGKPHTCVGSPPFPARSTAQLPQAVARGHALLTVAVVTFALRQRSGRVTARFARSRHPGAQHESDQCRLIAQLNLDKFTLLPFDADGQDVDLRAAPQGASTEQISRPWTRNSNPDRGVGASAIAVYLDKEGLAIAASNSAEPATSSESATNSALIFRVSRARRRRTFRARRSSHESRPVSVASGRRRAGDAGRGRRWRLPGSKPTGVRPTPSSSSPTSTAWCCSAIFQIGVSSPVAAAATAGATLRTSLVGDMVSAAACVAAPASRQQRAARPHRRRLAPRRRWHAVAAHHPASRKIARLDTAPVVPIQAAMNQAIANAQLGALLTKACSRR